jgi:hypothetical protein
MNPSPTAEDDPGLEGPDYVTLVIEWNDDDDTATLVRAEAPDRALTSGARHPIVAILGALSALALLIWSIRHLRTAS